MKQKATAFAREPVARWARLLTLFGATCAASCGGGGGSDTPAAPTPPPPPSVAALVGVDSNSNNVRDNVETEITVRYAAAPAKRDLAMAMSASVTVAMRARATDGTEARAAVTHNVVEETCLRRRLSALEKQQLELEVLLSNVDTAERATQLNAIREAAGAFELEHSGELQC